MFQPHRRLARPIRRQLVRGRPYHQQGQSEDGHLRALRGVWRRHPVICFFAGAGAGSLVVSGVAAAATSSVSLQPGDSVTVSCSGTGIALAANSATQEAMQCQAPDLEVLSVSVSPTNPAPGQGVIFSATVKNIGPVATPKAFGTAFLVDGTKVSWHDASSSLAAGATATYTANDGPAGSPAAGTGVWDATAGAHTIEAFTNDMSLFPEVATTNNTMTSSLSVGSSSTSTTSTTAAPTTTTTAPPSTTTTTTTTAGTSSSMSPPAGYAASQLIFDDSFAGNSLNASHWNTFISDANSNFKPWNSNGSGGSGMNAGHYAADYFEPSHLTVNNGLSIAATRGSTQPGYSWTSGVVSTAKKFAISRGYVQVKAWMPDMTTGMWPGIWFMGNQTELPEADLYEGGYTPNPNPDFAANLHSGSNTQQIPNTGVNLAAGWHTYGIDYEPGQSVTMFLDGVQVAKYTSSIPTGPYFLLLELDVAQNASGWHSVYSSSTPSPSVMKVAEVQAYGTAG